MSNNQKFIALPGGKTCKRVTTVTFPLHPDSDNPTFPLTEVMPEGETFSGSEVYALKNLMGDIEVISKYQYLSYDTENRKQTTPTYNIFIAINPLKAKEPVNVYGINEPDIDKVFNNQNNTKLKNEFQPLVDVVENKETVEQAAERHYPPYPMATILSGNISVNTQEVISNRNAFVKGANWQQSQSIGGIVGFVLEYVAKNAQASQNQNLSAYIDKDSILNMKSDIIKEYNNGK